MVKSIAVQLFLLGTLLLTFLFLKPSPVLAVCNYDANSYTSYTEQSNKCLQAGESCNVNGSKVTESGHGCLGCDGTYCLNEFWSQTLSCSGNADAKAYCGQATCNGQSQSCGGDSDCCSGLKCSGGKCVGSCSQYETNQATCAENGGTWSTKTVNGPTCLSNLLICEIDGCPNYGLAGCGEAASCGWVYLGESRSCSYCKCPSSPPPATCTAWNLTSEIGYATNGNNSTQNAINSGNASACASGVNWYSNSSVSIPAILDGGTAPVKSICVRPRGSVSGINKIGVSDITNNVTIATNITSMTNSIFNLTPSRTNNPGETVTIQSGRSQSSFNGKTYCAKSDTIGLCASKLPTKVENGYPNGGYVTDIPTEAAPNQESNAGSDSINGDIPLTWSQTISDDTKVNGILIVGVAYRGNKNGITGNPNIDKPPYDKFFNNSIDDGDNDDYVRKVTIQKGTDPAINLTMVPGSHSQYFDTGDRGAKRHTSLWYIKAPALPSGKYQVTVFWKGTFPDPAESAAGSILYSGVNQTTPFAAINKSKGKVGTCDANGKCANEPSISNSANASQTIMAVIAGQTDQNYENPPALQPVARTRWRRLTNNRNIYGQGADIVGAGIYPSPQLASWKYGFTNATWAISSVVLNAAQTRQPNNLYWQNVDWGVVCGTLEKRNYVTVIDSNGNKIINGVATVPGQAENFSLTSYMSGANPVINPNPIVDTTYTWYVGSSNIAGGTTSSTDPRRVESARWTFKVKSGPNLAASFRPPPPPSSITQNGTTGGATFRITNTGGTVMTGVTATFDPGTGAAVQTFNTGSWPKTIPVGGYVDQGTNFILPGPGTYTARVTAIPATGVTETITGDNVATQNYTVNPRTAYFQTKAAGVTSLGLIRSMLPSATNAISLKSIGTALDAGIISAKTSITPGSGNYSENGGGTTPSGWNRISGTLSSPRIDELSYDRLFKNVMTNAGIDSTNINTECTNRGVLVPGTSITAFSPSSQIKIFCYSNILLSDTELNTALSTIPDNTFGIFVPTSAASRTFGNAGGTITTPGKKRAAIFVNSHLTINSNVTVTNTLGSEAGLVTIVNGNITLSNSVSQLDGVYIFSGTFSTNPAGASGAALATQLVGNGSLIGTGASAFSLTRTYGTTTPTGSPAELWTYQPKYLWLFRNILTQPSYSWKELPPQ